MGLCEIKSEINPASVGAVDELLLEHGLANWSVFEDIILKRAWIVGVCPDDASANAEWSSLTALLEPTGVMAAPPDRRPLAEADWRDSYKAHFQPWQFGRLHWVPTWLRDTFVVPAGDAVLWLDPGLAFGTGNHETTRLCVERLVALTTQFRVRDLEAGDKAELLPTADSSLGEETPSSKFRAPNFASRTAAGVDAAGNSTTQNAEPTTPNRARPPGRVLDAGCGSGILALSAVLLGFSDVVGFDNDPEAVRISEENARLNGLAERVHFFVGDLVSGLAGRQADIVLANIQADVLMRFAPQLVAAVAPGGALVLSGILASENAHVRTTFEALSPNWAVNARTMGEWSDVVLTRPA